MENQKTTIKNRLIKNFKIRKSWIQSEQIEAYRLYDRDIPEFPYIIDRYGDYAVIYKKTHHVIDEHKSHFLDYIVDCLKEDFKIECDKIIIKERRSFDHKNEQYEKSKGEDVSLIVREGPLKFEVNLTTYLDTGLFLDHRPFRKTLQKICRDKRVLNLFCYTGSLSVSAACGGAKSVTSVDLSHTYLEWCKNNFKLNQISMGAHSFKNQDVIEFLDQTIKLTPRPLFDLIILDPPTFSNSKKMDADFDIQKDHVGLIDMCMQLLHPEGCLYFSNNKRDFKCELALLPQYNIKNTTSQTIPKDFHDQKIHHSFQITHQK